jgi:hypothetical protein
MCFPTLQRLALTTVILLIYAATAPARTDNGTIDGVVTDVMGAVVARARVVITVGLSSRELETNEMGQFHATVPLGLCRITVESPGFKVAKLNRVRVTAGASRSLKIVLAVRPVKHGKCPKGGPPCIWL